VVLPEVDESIRPPVCIAEQSPARGHGSRSRGPLVCVVLHAPEYKARLDSGVYHSVLSQA
jgi:hypothetical protein